MGRRLNPNIGGQQFSMDFMLPKSDWVAPTELPDLTRHKVIAIDTEDRDDGLAQDKGPFWYRKSRVERGYVCGVGVAWEGSGIYVPVEHPDTPGCFSRETVARWLLPAFRSDTLFVFQNAPFDIGWFSADFGLPPPNRIADIRAAAMMVDENRLKYDLDSLCEWCGIPGKDETILREAAAAYKCHPKKDIYKLPARFVGPYGAWDPGATLGVWNKLLPIMEREKTLKAFQTEMDLIPLVHEMRLRGVRVNVDTAERTQKELYAKRDRLLTNLADRLEISRSLVGIDEIRKTSVLAKWHDAHRIAYPSTEPTKGHPEGQPSFRKQWMQVHPHWLPRLVTEIEQTHDAAEKFIGKFLLDFVYQDRLHPTINQFRSSDDEGNTSGTRSHRFSYADPPLQQAPARNVELCVAFRGCFEPEQGEIWGSHDYSQQEYKWMVHYAFCNGLPKADAARQKYLENPDTDFHELVAGLTGLSRRSAKDVNFAKAYGAGVSKFALMTGLTEEEAQRVMQQYDTEMPFIKELDKKCKEVAGSRGWLTMKDGARAHFDTWEPWWIPIDVKKAGYKDPMWQSQMYPCSEEEAARRFKTTGHPWAQEGVNRQLKRGFLHKALNRLIQGVSARQTKEAMVACWHAGIVPLLQMHDELNFSCPDEAYGKRAAEIMREALPGAIPMKVDAEYGKTWGHARKVEIKLADGTKQVTYSATWQEAVQEMGQLAA